MSLLRRGIISSGKLGGAVVTEFNTFRYDENSDMVTIPVVAANDLTGDQTWVSWFWMDNIADSMYMLTKGGTDANVWRAPWLGSVTGDGKVRANLYPTIGSNSGLIIVTTTNSFNAGAWNLVSLTLDTTANEMTVRLNGVSTTATYSVNVGSATGLDWLIGRRSTTIPDGSLARQMIFDRVLSNSEIDSLSPTGNVPNYLTIPTVITDDCVGAWECSGKDATGADLSGTSNGVVSGTIGVDGEVITYENFVV